MAQSSENAAFDEYKLFYESAERVTDRRLANNRWNYAVCLGVLVAFATITPWAMQHLFNFRLGMGAIFTVSLLSSIFCRLWIKQIADFKNLNAAKFSVLAEMARSFREDFEEQIPLHPFDREWEILQEANALTSSQGPIQQALASTTLEIFLPKAMTIVFSTVCLLSAAVLLLVELGIVGLPSS